jgi:post-segregation antitoxin (ccd killing protein)
MRMPKHVAEPPKLFRSKKTKKREGRRQAQDPPVQRIGQVPNKHGPKRPVNVSISRDILAAAKRLKINLSDVLERELAKLTEDERIRRFRDEHRAFFDSHNAHIERYGTLSEALEREDDPSV